MWSVLCKFPSELVGSGIFSFLDWRDVVHIDTAAVSQSLHVQLRAMMRCIPHLEVPMTPSATLSLLVWDWFWKRGISLSGIKIKDNFNLQWSAIDAHAHLIAGGVDIVCESVPSANSLLVELLSQEEFKVHLVSGFHSWMNFLDHDLWNRFVCKFRNLKRLTAAGSSTTASDDWLSGVVRMNPSLEVLTLDVFVKIRDHLSALTLLRNLKEFVVLSHFTTNDEFESLVRAFPLLERITVYRLNGAPYITEDGLTVLAQSCPRLQSVTVNSGDPAPAALFQLALRCHQLRELKFAYHTPLSDAVLEALSQNCPFLHTLHCGWSNEVSSTGAANAAALLGQLRHLEITGQAEYDSDSVVAVLKHTSRLQTLKIRAQRAVMTAAELDAASWTGSGGLRVVALNCHVHLRAMPEEVEAALVRLAQRNPRLTHLNLDSLVFCSPAVIFALANNCPNLVEVTIPYHPQGIPDDAVVALVQACPQLQVLAGLFGEYTTDTAVLALAAHCPRLQSLTRTATCKKITADALEQLVRACRRLVGVLALPTTLTMDDRNRIQEVAQQVRRQAAEEMGCALHCACSAACNATCSRGYYIPEVRCSPPDRD